MNYNELNDPAKIKSETRRWFILFIFVAHTIAAGIQWMQYSRVVFIRPPIRDDYAVLEHDVRWIPDLFILNYILLTILPALWFLDKFGNRISMLVASGGFCLSTAIKMLVEGEDVDADFLMLGRVMEATSLVLTFGLTGSVTAAWFGLHEIALAGSLASFSYLFGLGVGRWYPAPFIKNLHSDEEFARGLFDSWLLLAVYMAVVFIVFLLFFQDQPKKPPSSAQIVRNEKRKQSNPGRNLVQLMKKKSLLMILLIYGIHFSFIFSSVSRLDFTFKYYFPNNKEDHGWVLCIIILSGTVGSLMGGYILDRKRLFKETTYTFQICSALCLTAYTMAFYYGQLILVYVFACMLGVFMFGSHATILQLAYEMIYPLSEGTVAALALCSIEITRFILMPVYLGIFDRFGLLSAHFSLIFLQVVGVLLTLGISAKYRRQQAEMAPKSGKTVQVFIKEIENDTD